eukprot:TRINITY_DN1090_c0_g1_i8.p1 TRINITY_DN1090_c0_g1~~TRINITY_DN1090_c0_g1_i8.p1  ORF type:complete len:197 (-),score=7.30 TRINITY_DN1090_c0_g1_i8:92-682(-)
MRFRLAFVNPSDGAYHYWPSEAGSIKYMYTDHSRLESASFEGVKNAPLGTFQVQLQVACGTEGGTYNWSYIYGEVVILVACSDPKSRIYKSPWFFVSSTKNNIVAMPHTLGTAEIAGYNILFAETNLNPTKTWTVTSHYCTQHADFASAIHCGAIEFTTSQFSIPLWEGGFVGRFWSCTEGWITKKTGFYQVTLWS